MNVRVFPILGLLTAALLSACGGGGGSDSSSGTATAFIVDPATITPASATSSQPFLDRTVPEFYAYGSTCSSATAAQSVLVTDNTVTYNDGTASAAQMKRVAQYAEAAVRTLRDKFGIAPANGIGFDGQKLRVCAAISGSDAQTNGSAGIRTLHIGAPDGYGGLGTLILHESTHVVQAQALNCQTQQYGWERWLTEGMALHVASRDLPGAGALDSLQANFAGIDGNLPFGDMDQRAAARSDRYPGYVLAVATLLGETGKTDVDIYRFMKSVGETSGCPGDKVPYVPGQPVAGWKAAFDASFGTDLRGTGVAGSGFWALAKKYAK
ncbi:hypothetical protein SNE35_23420 [Paucibacter sp. R3-3]|uniref:Lipoprotein n=1 Tax=Roseateles agri TaxID=3098619 RepID=A0ABU5DMW0_9BURK|nr:hypothetical protein [Paucibacter sp. R3-3]MDY0747474.1 hypothetical protein [Paucibacter sp. R3-3]